MNRFPNGMGIALRIKLGIRGVLLILFVFLAACGQATDTNSSNEAEWRTGQGELADRIGNRDQPVKGIPTQQSIYHDNEEIWDKTEYEAPSGKWFLHEGEGVFGYGLTTGTQKAGAELKVELFSHEDEGEELNRDVRVQLTERDNNYQKIALLIDETLHVETIQNQQAIFTEKLPDKENVLYLLSVEILNEEGTIEDTRISILYVPKQEMNAAVHLDKARYESSEKEAILTLDNFGPTILLFGKSYTIEKKVGDTWRVVPLDIAFEEIGLSLSIGGKYEQKVAIGDLYEGEYRVTKEIRADGLELQTVLAKEFTIE